MAALSLPLIVPAIRLDQDAARESARALARAREPWLAGFLVFGGEARLRVNAPTLQRAAAPTAKKTSLKASPPSPKATRPASSSNGSAAQES